MIKRILILALLIGLIFIIGLLTYDHSDWRLEFSMLDYYIGINSAMLAAGFLTILILLYAVISLLRMPFKWLTSISERRNIQLFNTFMDGLSLYTQGCWKQAYKKLTRSGRETTYQFHANLLAAHCCLQQKQIDAAQTALTRARQATSRNDFALDLAEAQILIAKNQNARAQVLLRRLYELQPQNTQVKALLDTVSLSSSSLTPSP